MKVLVDIPISFKYFFLLLICTILNADLAALEILIEFSQQYEYSNICSLKASRSFLLFFLKFGFFFSVSLIKGSRL